MKKIILLTGLIFLTSCTSNIIKPENIKKKYNPETKGLVIIGLHTNKYDFLLKNKENKKTIKLDKTEFIETTWFTHGHATHYVTNYVAVSLNPGNYTISEILKDNYRHSKEKQLTYSSKYQLSFNIKNDTINYIGTIKKVPDVQSKYIDTKYKKVLDTKKGKLLVVPNTDIYGGDSLEFTDTYDEMINRKYFKTLKIDKKIAKSTFLNPSEVAKKLKREFEQKFEKKCKEKDFFKVGTYEEYNKSYTELCRGRYKTPFSECVKQNDKKIKKYRKAHASLRQNEINKCKKLNLL